jgi:DNA modification methylase
MVFSGSNDSWEQHYQALKRAWRFPQDKTVKVFLPYTQFESEILDNVLRKREQMELDFEQQESLYADSLYGEIQQYLETDFIPIRKETEVTYDPVITPDFEMYHVDSIKSSLEGLKENEIDLIVTSIPFRNDLFAYTDNAGDMGNSGGVGEAGKHEFNLHLAYCLKGMYNTLKPGRLCCIEIGQSPLRKGVDGVIGMSDFRGDVIRGAVEAGFYQVGEWPVLGNPQAEAIVKHISTLNMNFVHEDRSRLAPMLNDYILIFRKPGENETPITNQVVYYPLDVLVETFGYQDSLTANGQQADMLDREWQLYLDEPAKNEWHILEIDNQLVLRNDKIISVLVALRNGVKPDCVKVDERMNWLVPVVRSQVTNENWIEYADGIAQVDEFNRTSHQGNATSQRARYDASWSEWSKMYDSLVWNVRQLEDMIQNGEMTKKEVIMSFMGILYDIDQTQTLNTPYTRGRTKDMENADKHVCPFSIPLVNRLIRMYSNPGDVVLDPFAGVGTVPMVALELGRKAIGKELKPEYFLQAVDICQQVIRQPEQMTLF